MTSYVSDIGESFAMNLELLTSASMAPTNADRPPPTDVESRTTENGRSRVRSPLISIPKFITLPPRLSVLL